MTPRENYLRALRFEKPEYIPMNYVINTSCWEQYPQDELFALIERHPLLFPGFRAPKLPFKPNYAPITRKDQPFRDDFGCIWETPMDGMTGTVTGHPLADWDNFASFVVPDPDKCTGIGPVDWEAQKNRFARNTDRIRIGSLRHGHTFLQLSDLRGYQNLLFDMIDEEPLLWKLIEKVEEFNYGIVQHFLQCELDGMAYAEDLGMQSGPMLSPELFRKYIKPSYQRLIRPAKEKGLFIHMHSDGDIRTLVDDLLDGGVEIVNLQDLVNGVDWIADRLGGKVCVELDIDRQNVTVNGTPEDIDRLIRTEVESIGRKEGGLMMVYGLYPGTPLCNAAAVMDAMEKYMGYYS